MKKREVAGWGLEKKKKKSIPSEKRRSREREQKRKKTERVSWYIQKKGGGKGEPEKSSLERAEE